MEPQVLSMLWAPTAHSSNPNIFVTQYLELNDTQCDASDGRDKVAWFDNYYNSLVSLGLPNFMFSFDALVPNQELWQNAYYDYGWCDSFYAYSVISYFSRIILLNTNNDVSAAFLLAGIVPSKNARYTCENIVGAINSYFQSNSVAMIETLEATDILNRIQVCFSSDDLLYTTTSCGTNYTIQSVCSMLENGVNTLISIPTTDFKCVDDPWAWECGIVFYILLMLVMGLVLFIVIYKSITVRLGWIQIPFCAKKVVVVSNPLVHKPLKVIHQHLPVSWFWENCPGLAGFVEDLPPGVCIKGGVARKLVKIYIDPSVAEPPSKYDIDVEVLCDSKDPEVQRSIRDALSGTNIGGLVLEPQDIEVSNPEGFYKYFFQRDVTMNEVMVLKVEPGKALLMYTDIAEKDIRSQTCRPSMHCLCSEFSVMWRLTKDGKPYVATDRLERTIIRRLKGHGKRYAFDPITYEYYRKHGLGSMSLFKILRHFHSDDTKYNNAVDHLINIGFLHRSTLKKIGSPNLMWGFLLDAINKKIAMFGGRFTLDDMDVAEVEIWVNKKKGQIGATLLDATIRAPRTGFVPSPESVASLGIYELPEIYGNYIKHGKRFDPATHVKGASDIRTVDGGSMELNAGSSRSFFGIPPSLQEQNQIPTTVVSPASEHEASPEMTTEMRQLYAELEGKDLTPPKPGEQPQLDARQRWMRRVAMARLNVYSTSSGAGNPGRLSSYSSMNVHAGINTIANKKANEMPFVSALKRHSTVDSPRAKKSGGFSDELGKALPRIDTGIAFRETLNKFDDMQLGHSGDDETSSSDGLATAPISEHRSADPVLTTESSEALSPMKRTTTISNMTIDVDSPADSSRADALRVDTTVPSIRQATSGTLNSPLGSITERHSQEVQEEQTASVSPIQRATNLSNIKRTTSLSDIKRSTSHSSIVSPTSPRTSPREKRKSKGFTSPLGSITERHSGEIARVDEKRTRYSNISPIPLDDEDSNVLQEYASASPTNSIRSGSPRGSPKGMTFVDSFSKSIKRLSSYKDTTGTMVDDGDDDTDDDEAAKLQISTSQRSILGGSSRETSPPLQVDRRPPSLRRIMGEDIVLSQQDDAIISKKSSKSSIGIRGIARSTSLKGTAIVDSAMRNLKLRSFKTTAGGDKKNGATSDEALEEEQARNMALESIRRHNRMTRRIMQDVANDSEEKKLGSSIKFLRELAEESKRNGDFKAAFEYYEKALDQQLLLGSSVKVTQQRSSRSILGGVPKQTAESIGEEEEPADEEPEERTRFSKSRLMNRYTAAADMELDNEKSINMVDYLAASLYNETTTREKLGGNAGLFNDGAVGEETQRKGRLMASMRIARFLAGVLLFSWKKCIMALFFILLSAACQLYLPSLQGYAINLAVGDVTDSSSQTGDFVRALLGDDADDLDRVLVLNGIFMVAVVLFYLIGMLFQQYYTAFAMREFFYRMFTHLVNQDLGFYSKLSTGEILARTGGDSLSFRGLISSLFFTFIEGVLLMCGSILFLVYQANHLFEQSKLYTVFIFTVQASLVVTGFFFGFFIRRHNLRSRQSMGRMFGYALDSFVNINTICSLSIADRTSRDYWKYASDYFEAAKVLNIWNALMAALTSMTSYAILFATLWVGTHAILDRTLAVGDFYAILIYVSWMRRGTKATVDAYSKIMSTVGSVERVVALHDKGLMRDVPDRLWREDPRFVIENNTVTVLPALQFRDKLWIRFRRAMRLLFDPTSSREYKGTQFETVENLRGDHSVMQTEQNNMIIKHGPSAEERDQDKEDGKHGMGSPYDSHISVEVRYATYNWSLVPRQQHPYVDKKHEIRGAFYFKNIHFVYPIQGDLQVLRGATVKAEEGDIVILTGESDSGKSTLLQVIQLLYRPFNGARMFGMRNSDKWMRVDESLDVKQFRRQISVVSRFTNGIFNCSFEDNLAIGEDSPVPSDAIRKVAKLVNLHETILSYKNGYHERLGDMSGIDLSSSQIRRIMLARALLKRPHILLIDDADLFLFDLGQDFLLLLKALSNAGVCVVLATSFPDQLESIASSIVTLTGGFTGDEDADDQASDVDENVVDITINAVGLHNDDSDDSSSKNSYSPVEHVDTLDFFAQQYGNAMSTEQFRQGTTVNDTAVPTEGNTI